MLTPEDIILIEKVCDNQIGHPDAMALTTEEKDLFKRRMKDLTFKRQFNLSNKIDEIVSDEETIDLIQKIDEAKNNYHKK
ncbi:MAG: hypothetical protein WAZ12_02920 [Candidatus Absconditicoccaceae bacterium]